MHCARRTPQLLVVDLRAEGAAREARVQLSDAVRGWNPCTGDEAAGFGECKMGVLGSTLQLSLRPGDGVLVSLSMYEAGTRRAARSVALDARARLARARHGSLI